jgi:hypothetical protein
VVAKLDRLARSLRDASDIMGRADREGVKLNIGGSVHDPLDPVGRLLFNVLATVAEFESDLIRSRTREGCRWPKPRAGCGASRQSFQYRSSQPAHRAPTRRSAHKTKPPHDRSRRGLALVLQRSWVLIIMSFRTEQLEPNP